MDILPEYPPYYENIKIDHEGNILVFNFYNYNKVRRVKFDVYSHEGNYLCFSEFDITKPLKSRDFERALFFDKGFIYYPFINDEDFNLRRMKAK